MANPYWKAQVPIYVTNEYDGKQQGMWAVAGWLHMLMFLLLIVNFVGWGIVGAITLVGLL